MCCFSRPVEDVSNTRIFARLTKGGGQIVVYSMQLTADEELAMILPIPVRQPAKEDAVKFINLKEYPEFFTELESGFPKPTPKPTRAVPGLGGFGALDDKQLEVVDVGDFIASFVPTVADFARIDDRFKLSKDVWDKLPQYKDYGFTVFQLKKGTQKVHPMAFEFPRRHPKALFFPTVHIHDGTVHPKADFHHTLYCQASDKILMNWAESPQPAAMFMKKLKQFPDLMDGEGHCYRRTMNGELKNEDVLV
jgi:hypothetical protein